MHWLVCITSRPCFVNQYIHSVRYSTTVSRITEQCTSDGDGLVMGLTVEPNRHVVPCRPLLCRVFFSYTSLVCHSTPVMCVTVHVRRGRLGDGRDGEPGGDAGPVPHPHLCLRLHRGRDLRLCRRLQAGGGWGGYNDVIEWSCDVIESAGGESLTCRPALREILY